VALVKQIHQHTQRRCHTPQISLTSQTGCRTESNAARRDGQEGGLGGELEEGSVAGRAGEEQGEGSVGAMTVWIDDLTRPVLVTPIHLPLVLGLTPTDKLFARPRHACTHTRTHARTHTRTLTLTHLHACVHVMQTQNTPTGVGGTDVRIRRDICASCDIRAEPHGFHLPI
jgi:hypothetical protein